MKTIIRLPTDEYAYIEQEFDKELSPQEAIEAYNALKTAYKGGGEGLPQKEWNSALDEYNNTGRLLNGLELWNRMNELQKFTINEQKKSFKRMESRRVEDGPSYEEINTDK